MKILDILEALEKPKNVYSGRDPNIPITIDDLTPEERDELFKKGTLLIKINDPSRPDVSASQVITLPKIDQIKKDITQNKKEFSIFTFSPNATISAVAEEINVVYNRLYKAMDALDKLLKLQKQGRL